MTTAVETWVEIDLDDIEVEDLKECLEKKGYYVTEKKPADKTEISYDGSVYNQSRIAILEIASRCKYYEDVKNFYHDMLAVIVHLPTESDDQVLLNKLKEMMR